MSSIITDNTHVVGRQRAFKADITGLGDGYMEMRPQQRGAEYVVVPIGKIRKGEPLTGADVIAALRHVLSLWEYEYPVTEAVTEAIEAAREGEKQ